MSRQEQHLNDLLRQAAHDPDDELLDNEVLHQNQKLKRKKKLRCAPKKLSPNEEA